MRVRVVVSYDGTDYCGFQRQANAPTVQGALEAALEQVTQQEIRILAAGRTDAGVHAEGQIIAFDTSWRHGLDVLKRALNAVLPRDVAVRTVTSAAAEFHPRFDACSRRYRYTLYNAPVRNPFTRRYSLHVVDELDLAAMQEAAGLLIGEHDFGAFGQPPQGNNTVRSVRAAECSRQGPFVFFDVEANAFLYRMVRSIVGTLLEVGRSKLDPEAFCDILESCDRSQAGPTLLPHGLCLIEVKY